MLYAGSIARYGKMDLDEHFRSTGYRCKFYFEESYKASKRILMEGGFSLFKKYDDKSKNYQYLFREEDNNEVIWAKNLLKRIWDKIMITITNQSLMRPWIASITNP